MSEAADLAEKGAEVRALRMAVGGRAPTQEEVAGALAVHPCTVVDIEKGRLYPLVGRYGWAALKRAVQGAVAELVAER